MTLLHRTLRALACCLVTLVLVGPGVAQKITIWVDDAHTSRIQVDKLDPNEIADPSSFSLGAGISIGHIGVSIGWSREQGVEYGKKAQELIDQIRALCEEFNNGELSLETYQRRVRRIFNGIEAARICSMEFAVQLSLEANEASRRMDEALGLAALDDSEYEKRITAAVDAFRTLVEAVRPHDMPTPAESAALGAGVSDYGRGESAVKARLADLDAALRPAPIRSKRDRRLINIWKDDSRTVQIAVPMLDVEGLVQEFEHSLCVQMKYSLPLVSLCVGRDIQWTVQAKAKYDEAAQLLIVKYRKLCLEYNSSLISQEGYFKRLVELMEAERRAFSAREEMTRRLDESKAAMEAELEKRVGALPPVASDLRAEMDEKRRVIDEVEEKRRPASAVEQISEGHRADMKAWDTFVATVGEFRVGSPSDTVEVWVDDRRERKVVVPRLDTDIIAASVRTRLSLQISFFNLGPECTWAKQKGTDYGHAAQLLIIKSKQLCMDYNAGLISQETYLRNSRQIDASVEKAAEVRQGLTDFYAALAGAAFARADQIFEREKGRKR